MCRSGCHCIWLRIRTRVCQLSTSAIVYCTNHGYAVNSLNPFITFSLWYVCLSTHVSSSNTTLVNCFFLMIRARFRTAAWTDVKHHLEYMQGRNAKTCVIRVCLFFCRHLLVLCLMSDTMSYRWLIIPRKGAWGLGLSLALVFNT